MVLLILSSAGKDIRATLMNLPLMAGISAVMMVMIPKLVNRETARTWGQLMTLAVLGGLAGPLTSILCLVLLRSAQP